MIKFGVDGDDDDEEEENGSSSDSDHSSVRHEGDAVVFFLPYNIISVGGKQLVLVLMALGR